MIQPLILWNFLSQTNGIFENWNWFVFVCASISIISGLERQINV